MACCCVSHGCGLGKCTQIEIVLSRHSVRYEIEWSAFLSPLWPVSLSLLVPLCVSAVLLGGAMWQGCWSGEPCSLVWLSEDSLHQPVGP